MKISYNWLRDYLNLNQSPEELAEILTNTGLEVEGFSPFCSIPGGLEGLVVGEVISKEKHPNADKLSLCKVNIGQAENLSIVCGAPNVAAGQKVIVAPVNTLLFPTNGESFTIKQSKIRGELSEGMICAEDEIGLGFSHDGIMVLDQSTKIGLAAAQLFDIKQDYIFEINLTPNRTDAMSHIGVARDIMAALRAQGKDVQGLKMPELFKSAATKKSSISIQVENQEACPRYAGIVVENIKIAPSPKWMQHRLSSIGVRPINNVVDITNYILKEYGQALHAFDLQAVKGKKIIIKNLAEQTPFVTLDGESRKLSAKDLMICNAEEAMCMAGIFGGKDSGVSNDTHAIFLESAYFEGGSIRQSSTHHQLRTDAAQRYEKGADPELCVIALERACFLLKEYAGAEINENYIDVYPKKIEEAKIKFRWKRLNQLSGIDFNQALVLNILKDLDFKILHQDELYLELNAPLYRADVFREVDVIEEIMRIYGFNNIASPSRVKSTLSFQEGINLHQLKEKVASNLNGLSYSEILTNSISQSSYYEEDVKLVRLQNSMTAELDCMRASLIPEALKAIQYNINRKRGNLKFFEFGKIYNEHFEEKEQLAIFLTGNLSETNWNTKAEKTNIFHLKGLVEALLKELGVQDLNTSIINEREIYFDRKNLEIAKVWQLDSADLGPFEIDQAVFCARINWDGLVKLLEKKKVRFKEISKFPEVSRDLAIIIDEHISFDSILAKLRAHSGIILKNIDLFDIFRNEEKIGLNKKSYALNFKLQDATKTLTDKEIEKVINRIIKILEQDFDATIRK